MAAAPLSLSDEVALLEGGIACVTDSYEFQVHCLEQNGETAGIFGEAGEGPGQFRGISGLERAIGGAVGVIDNRLKRLSFFDASGSLLSENTLHTGLQARQLVGNQVFGLVTDYSNIDRATVLSPPSGDRRAATEALAGLFVPTLVDMSSGQLVWAKRGLGDGVDCLLVQSGALAPDGTMVFWTCGDEIVFFEDDEGSGEPRRSPAYVEAFPSEREVQEFADGMKRLFGVEDDRYVAAFRTQPRSWYLGNGRTFRFDDQGRTWAATSHDRIEESYIEVWDGPEFVSIVAIHDRLLGYDVLGDILVALVERTPGPEGIAPRGVDWYAIPSSLGQGP